MDNEVAKVCIWREARGEPLGGIEAVCWVIRNRMYKQNKSSYEIVTEHWQFSSMTIPSDPQLYLYPSLADTHLQAVNAAYEAVMNSIDADPTGGALFYRNEATSNSVWFDNAVRDGKLIKTVTIGNHTFYKQA